ncbi:MAG: hypothetical protein AB1458_13720 [Bacteroidota bacterium]
MEPGLIPDYLTHYYLPDRKPFLSLSDLDEENLERVLSGLKQKAERGETKRGFATWYVEERKKTELFLRSEFINKGGKPQRQYPIYFVLGKSDCQKNRDPAQAELRINLSDIPKDVISFTYPDSMATMILKNDPPYRQPYHGRLFTYAEILDVVRKYGFPRDEAARTSKFLYPNYIEVQLWSDEPVREFL